MTDFLTFRKMITPILVTVFFWIGVAFNVILGIGLIVTGLGASAAAAHSASEGFGGGGFGGGPFGGGVPGGVMVFAGLVTLVVGPLLTRITCELLILSFRIYETLVEIRDQRSNAAPLTAPLPIPRPDAS